MTSSLVARLLLIGVAPSFLAPNSPELTIYTRRLPTIIIKDRFFYQNYYNKLVGYMERSMSAFDAKTHFSKILDRASKGEEILITKRGKVTAKIVPVSLVKDID